MEKVGDMKFIDFEDVLDRDLGKVGTPKRDDLGIATATLDLGSIGKVALW